MIQRVEFHPKAQCFEGCYGGRSRPPMRDPHGIQTEFLKHSA